jgi:hypothetical protein
MKPSEYVALLEPTSKFVICSYFPHLANTVDEPDPKGLWDSGCKAISKQRFLVFNNGDYLLIRDIEDLKYNFSPVDSTEKALGYALAATGFSAEFNFEQLKNYRILVDNLQATSVNLIDGGYEMILYNKPMCGQGPHTTYMNTVKVTTTGDVQILESIPAFENPEEDNLIVD